MSWLGGIEVVVGLGALALAVFLVGIFRLSPQSDAAGPPSQTRLTFVPIFILLIAVVGIALILTGIGFV